jgi:hypothetical protein
MLTLVLYTNLAIWTTDGSFNCVLRYSGTEIIVFLSIWDSISLFGCLLVVQRYWDYCPFVHLGQHWLVWMRTCGTAVLELLSFCRCLAQHRLASVLFLYIVFRVNENWSLLKTFHVKYARPWGLHPGIDERCQIQTHIALLEECLRDCRCVVGG